MGMGRISLPNYRWSIGGENFQTSQQTATLVSSQESDKLHVCPTVLRPSTNRICISLGQMWVELVNHSPPIGDVLCNVHMLKRIFMFSQRSERDFCFLAILDQ